MASLNVRAALLSVSFLILALGLWEMATQPPEAQTGMTEYEMLMGGADQESRVPPPSAVIKLAWAELSNPFYDAGANDKGIGIQLAYSVYRVLTGYLAAQGHRTAHRLPDRYVAADVQGPEPLHPGAATDLTAGLDAAGPVHHPGLRRLGDLRDLYLLDLADAAEHGLRCGQRTSGLGERGPYPRAQPDQDGTYGHSSVIAAPTILTGMRIEAGIAWLVIVAAEMLVGGTGIGYYVWNEWNNLDLASVIFSILMIGVVGMLLDLALGKAQKLVEYKE